MLILVRSGSICQLLGTYQTLCKHRTQREIDHISIMPDCPECLPLAPVAWQMVASAENLSVECIQRRQIDDATGLIANLDWDGVWFVSA